MDILAFFAGGGSEAEGGDEGSLWESGEARRMWWASKGSKVDCWRSLEGMMRKRQAG
jgi:hypothetical protein